MDLRSLAACRVGLALVVLGDLAVRVSDLTAFYTDAGILPRHELLSAFPWLHQWPFCIHLVGGSWWSQALIFSITAAFALALLVGYRTRLATIAVWLLTASVQLRNLYIGHGSDAQLRMCLLWGCFLPLGARYSVDSARRWDAAKHEPQQWLSVGTLALLTQIVIIYLSTGYAKLQYPEWRTGLAVARVFDNEIWGTYTGHFLLQFPFVCSFFTHATLVLELGAPLLLLVPVFFGPIRTMAVVILVALHLGFGLAMRVGIFPFASIAALLSLLPAWFWDTVLARLRTPERLGARITFHDECRRCSTILVLVRTFLLLPETPIDGGAAAAPETGQHRWTIVDHAGRRYEDSKAVLCLSRLSPILWPLAPVLALAPVQQLTERWWKRFAAHRTTDRSLLGDLKPGPPTRRHWLLELSCTVLLVYVLVWNVGVVRDPNYTAPSWISWLGNTLFVQQDWRMYSRIDSRTGWVVIPGRLKDGTQVDLFRLGGPAPTLATYVGGDGVSFERPDPILYKVTNSRWLGMMDRLIHLKRGEQQRLLYGRYLCRSWNAHHEGQQQLDTFQIIFMARPTATQDRHYATRDYEPEVLWDHGCFR